MSIHQRIRKALGGGLVALALSPVLSMAQGDDMRLKVHVYPGNPTSLYTFIGAAKGFYKDAGLDVEMVKIASGPQANAALASGSVNVVLSSADNMLLLKEQKFKPVVISGNLVRPLFLLAAKDPSTFPHAGQGYPAVMQDFKGRTIGVYGRGSASDRFMRQLLREAGLSPDIAQYATVAGPSQSIAGLMSGQFDAVTEVFGGLIMAELTGAGKALLDCSVSRCPDSIEQAGKMAQVYFTTQEFIGSHEKAMKAFVEAHRKINAWVHDPSNATELKKVVSEVLPAPSGVDTDKYFGRMATDMQRYFGVTVDPKAVEATQAQMLASGELKQALPLDEMIWQGAPRN